MTDSFMIRTLSLAAFCLSIQACSSTNSNNTNTVAAANPADASASTAPDGQGGAVGDANSTAESETAGGNANTGEGSSGSENESTGATNEAGTTGGSADACITTEFDAQTGLVTTDEDAWVLTVGTSDSSAILSVESYDEWGGPTESGTFSLDGINYADCGLCVVVYADCNEEECASIFYADQGTVEIESIDLMNGGNVTISLTDVVLTEVTVDEETFTSTPVDNARTWCVDGQFSGAVTEIEETTDPESGD